MQGAGVVHNGTKDKAQKPEKFTTPPTRLRSRIVSTLRRFSLILQSLFVLFELALFDGCLMVV